MSDPTLLGLDHEEEEEEDEPIPVSAHRFLGFETRVQMIWDRTMTILIDDTPLNCANTITSGSIW